LDFGFSSFELRSLIVCAFLAVVARVSAVPNPIQDEWIGPIKRTESELRQRLGTNDGPQEIYALVSEGTWGGVGQRYLLIFSDHAVFYCDDGNGRTRERELVQDELARLTQWISANKIDNLPQFDEGTVDGIQYEYFHIKRGGDEHRVFMNNPPDAPIGAAAVFSGGKPAARRKLYGELMQRLLKLDQKPMRVIYSTLQSLRGFEVVSPKEKAAVLGFRARNNGVFALVSRSDDKLVEWHRLTSTGLASEFTVEQQKIDPSINQYESDKGFEVEEGPLKGARLQAEFANMAKRKDGLWVYRKGRKPEMLAEGIFDRPVLCPGGEWIVAAKTPRGKLWDVPNGIVRVHLPDKRLFDVDLPPADNFDPVTWLNARGRVLLYRQRDWQDWKAGPQSPEFHLLDPVTGATERVEGEMRPLFDAAKHDLQPTGKPNEVWAALHSSVVDPNLRTTTVGRFDTYNFRFSPIAKFTDVHFASSNIFVDETAKVIWVAVNGDLLRLSLPE
jgi:hypothetical protein